MCFPLVVVRAALFALRSLPVLLPAARTSDNRDASDAATIRTAASARNKPQHGSPPAPQMMTTAGAKISPFDVAKETVQANVSCWVISRPHALTHAKSASPSKAKIARGHRAPGEAPYWGRGLLVPIAVRRGRQ